MEPQASTQYRKSPAKKVLPCSTQAGCPFFSPTDHSLYSYILSRHTMIASFNVLLRMQDKYVAPGDLCNT